MNDITKAEVDRQAGKLFEIKVDANRGFADYEVCFIYWTPRGTKRHIPIAVDIREQAINVPATGPMPADVAKGFQQAVQYAHDLAIGIAIIVK